MPVVSVRGAPIWYSAHGSSGPRVVFLHAGGFDHSEWAPALRLVRGALRAWTPDLFGAGGSAPWPGPGEPTPRDQARVVDALAAVIGAPFHLVGHSYGGGVALAWAERNPDRALSLSLIEPTRPGLLRLVSEPSFGRALDEAVAAMTACVERVDRDPQGAARSFVEFWAGERFAKLIPDAAFASVGARMPELIASWRGLMAETPSVDALACVTCPALVIRSTLSSAASQAMCAALLRLWPDACAETVPNSGHMLPVTHARRVTALLRAHIASVEGAR